MFCCFLSFLAVMLDSVDDVELELYSSCVDDGGVLVNPRDLSTFRSCLA